MAQERKASKFVVDFGDAELSPEVSELMQANIQEAALRTIARIDFQGDVNFRIPPDWFGLILDGRFRNIRDVFRQ